MGWQRILIGLLVGAVFTSVGPAQHGESKEKKKTGIVVGILTEKKTDNPSPLMGWWVSVKADGEERPRRYWGYGAQPSADMKKQLAVCPLGSRVRVTWEVPDANEGPHVAKMELVKAPGKQQDKPKEKNRAGSI
jgi:hypothetical protein